MGTGAATSCGPWCAINGGKGRDGAFARPQSPFAEETEAGHSKTGVRTSQALLRIYSLFGKQNEKF